LSNGKLSARLVIAFVLLGNVITAEAAKGGSCHQCLTIVKCTTFVAASICIVGSGLGVSFLLMTSFQEDEAENPWEDCEEWDETRPNCDNETYGYPQTTTTKAQIRRLGRRLNESIPYRDFVWGLAQTTTTSRPFEQAHNATSEWAIYLEKKVVEDTTLGHRLTQARASALPVDFAVAEQRAKDLLRESIPLLPTNGAGTADVRPEIGALAGKTRSNLRQDVGSDNRLPRKMLSARRRRTVPWVLQWLA
jgi:hypothetical protein